MSNPQMGARTSTLFAFLLCIACLFVNDVIAIGINLGQNANNLLPPDEILLLVQSTTINKVKLFDANPIYLNAFAGSGIQIVIGTQNSDIVPLANTPGYAAQWVQANVVAFPNTLITIITVGNEILAYDASVAYQLLPAMQNLHAALVAVGLDARVKVCTPSDFSVLGESAPPSNASFRAWEGSILTPIMPFLAATGAPFMANPYPYFAYTSDPQNTSLDFVLFRPNATETRFDNVTNITYTSMWDAQIDALYTAIAKTGFTNVSIAISETGWPHSGASYEVGPGVANAQAFNGELIRRIDGNVGSPLRPGVPIDTYLFELFDEDLKTGAPSEQYFGLFFANGTPVYDVGIIPALWPPPPPVVPGFPPPPPAAGVPGTVNGEPVGR